MKLSKVLSIAVAVAALSFVSCASNEAEAAAPVAETPVEAVAEEEPVAEEAVTEEAPVAEESVTE